ncbi:hypothetical protein MRX96_040286 [Rhipicephalus microplus]
MAVPDEGQRRTVQVGNAPSQAAKAQLSTNYYTAKNVPSDMEPAVARAAVRPSAKLSRSPGDTSSAGNVRKWPQIVVTVVAVCFILFSVLFIVAVGKNRRPRMASVVLFNDRRPTTSIGTASRASTSSYGDAYEPRQGDATQDPQSVSDSAGKTSTAQSVVDATEDPLDVHNNISANA